MKKHPTEERGYIEIKRDEQGEANVEILLLDQTLWLNKYQMADLLKVNLSTISNSLRTIFQNGILQEAEVSYPHYYYEDDRRCEITLYSIDVFLSICFRINSPNSEAVREWTMKIVLDFCRFKYQEVKKAFEMSRTEKVS